MNAPVRAKTCSLPLRSKFYDWLGDNPQRMATVSQWQGVLNNLQTVRREEIERSGILHLLNNFYQPNDRVSLDELMGGIGDELQQCDRTLKSYWDQAFRPSLDVKTVTNQLPKRVEKKAKRFVEMAQVCYQHPSIGYWIVRSGYEDIVTVSPNWIVLDHKGKMLNSCWFPSALEAFDAMYQSICKTLNDYGQDQLRNFAGFIQKPLAAKSSQSRMLGHDTHRNQ